MQDIDDYLLEENFLIYHPDTTKKIIKEGFKTSQKRTIGGKTYQSMEKKQAGYKRLPDKHKRIHPDHEVFEFD